ncbi:MAG: Lrp/AsnC family transcriptional regulator [Veillonellaceae bacterium]|nr:Lrp/AsnC family transcriptional regulator [Veillonellaceae bacterium]
MMDIKRELVDILEHDARRSVSDIAAMLSCTEDEVKKLMKELVNDGTILEYQTLINWEKLGDTRVTALIEINLAPQREVGFDAVAERIYKFDEVKSVYLMSGSFDLMLVVEGHSLKEIANFVATRLSTIEGVTATSSHFMLKPYKKDGVVITGKEEDHRLVVTP